MDPKLIFWSGALAILAAVIACAGAGWHSIRRGEVERHRRFMNTAIWLIIAFLASYVAKVLTLGKEDLAAWSDGARYLLRIHETIVLGMLVAGTWARLLARKLDGAAAPAATSEPASRLALRRRHRLLGRTAVVAGAFALLTAAMLLVGMFSRA